MRSPLAAHTVPAYGLANTPDPTTPEAANMYSTQDIGEVRHELVHRAFAEQRARRSAASANGSDPNHLRALLDEAHARIRTLERAVATLTAAL
jgi:hypothetical protein